jgi:MFS family permease
MNMRGVSRHGTSGERGSWLSSVRRNLRESVLALNARSLCVIGAASAGWAFSFGLGSQVVSHWLNARGNSDTVIGLTHSFYYFGLAVASCLVPRLTRRLGPAWCAAFGMIGAGVTLALFPLADNVGSWYLLRFLNGWAGAMSLVPLETIVSRDSEPDKKTLNFGIYGVSLTVGGALGIFVGPHLYSLGYGPTFCVGACVPMVAAGELLIGMGRQACAAEQPGEGVPLGLAPNFLSYGTAWAQGFLEGGMLAFLLLFLEARGLSSEAAGTLMSVTMIGIILFQVPVAWLADRLGKTPMLLGCYGVVVLGLIAIPWLPNGFWLACTLFAFGAFTGAMYPLGLSLLSDKMAEAGLARAYAWYLAIECVGSQVGAAAMGKARDRWGESSMFAVGLAAVVGVLAVWLALRSTLRKKTAIEIAAPTNRQQAA